MRLIIETDDYREWLDKYPDGEYKLLPFVIKKNQHYDEYCAYAFNEGSLKYYFGTDKHTRTESAEAFTEMNKNYDCREVTEAVANTIEIVRTADRLGALK